MTTTISSAEEAQLAQTIEMFEVITQSQPHDYQSLEILKEAYSKLGREKDVIGTSKRIAEAYVQMGQLSSAILEYETILQRYPDDPDVQAALKQIESKANNFSTEPLAEPAALARPAVQHVTPERAQKPHPKAAPAVVEDGRRTMHKIFVDTKIISSGDFDLCWTTPDLSVPPNGVIEPFIQVLADKGILPVDKSLKILSDKSRCAFLPMSHYDIDMDLARTFPGEICQRWCIMPFDRMSKSILVATANPFNQQAAKDLSEATANRLLWYLVTPTELVKNLRKAFR
jgi:tetratricopeptide (TPR) repeat protein